MNTNANEFIDLTPISINNRNEIFGQKYENLKNKPTHWTEPYWENVTSTYKWFIHKDGFGGCSLCKANTTFNGRKSLIATMKFLLSEFTYEEFEKKLAEHEFSIQHGKSLSLYRGFRMSNNVDLKDVMPISPALINKKHRPLNFSCPLCKKGYVLKNGLIKHMHTCDNKFNPKGFLSPCGCKGYIFYSICAIDDHSKNEHPGKYLYNCKICSRQYERLTVLYGHMLLCHNFQWNPYEYMPLVSEARKKIKSPTPVPGPNRRKPSTELDDSLSTVDAVDTAHPTKRRTMSKPKIDEENIAPRGGTVNSQKKDSTPLRFSFEQIHLCKYCGGRYLSLSILKQHLSNWHPSEVGEATNDDIGDRRHKKRVLQLVVERLPIAAFANKPESFNQEIPTHCDTQSLSETVSVSACLLSCPLCQDSFATLLDRNHHVSKLHPEIEPFICPYCGLILMNYLNYNRHLENTHNCSIKQKTNKKSSTTTYSCTLCPLVFTNQTDLTNHMHLSHSDPPETIDSPEAGDEVLAILIGADPSESRCRCSTCDLSFHNRFERAVHSFAHMENSNRFDFPTCSYCCRLFFGPFSKLYLKDHHDFDHLMKVRDFCRLCSRTFSSSYCFLEHRIDGQCVPDIGDPYEPLSSRDRLAFSCSRCGTVVAGHDAEIRLEGHINTCAASIMAEDGILVD